MQSVDEEEQGAGTRGYMKHKPMAESPVFTADTADDTGQTTPSNGLNEDIFDDSCQVKTAYYNAASEKSLSHEEAKLFYQRHQLEQAQMELEGYSPISRARTFSLTADGDGGLSRTTSTASRRSGRGYASRDRDRMLPVSAPDLDSQSTTINVADLPGTDEDAHLVSDNADADGVEGARRGLGLGSDTEGSTIPGSDISPELSAISVNIKKVLEMRHRFINLSLQGPSDNPKDGPDWRIYPPPPNPTWDANKNRPKGQTRDGNSLSNGSILPEKSQTPKTKSLSTKSLPPVSPTPEPRKPGQDIGEDFDISDLLPLPGNDERISFGLGEGSVYQIYQTSKTSQHTVPLVWVPTLREFYKDLDEVQNISSDGPTKSFAYRQLDIIEGKFHLHFLVNSYQEVADCKKVPHRDFYNVRKVDTHVHHSACMNQKHLLRFIKSKMRKSRDEIVMFRDNMELTLKQVFESINLTAYDLSIDTLDMHVGFSLAVFICQVKYMALTLDAGSHRLISSFRQVQSQV